MFGKDTKLASIADAVKEIMEASPVKIQTPQGTRVLGTRYGNSAKAHRDQTADPFAGHKGPAKKDLEDIEKPKKKEESFNYFTKKLLNDLQEDKEIQKQIDEVLKKDASAGDWIHDFVHSDNPKFAGKSKAKRKEMALAAYYAKQRKEEVEQIEEGIEVKKEYNDKTEAEHGVYHNGKKIGYVVHHKPSGTHTAYHSPQDDDDYGQIDDFRSHHDAVSQIRHSAGVGVHEEVESDEVKYGKDEAEETTARKSIKAKETEKDQKISNQDPRYGKPNAFCEESEEVDEALIGGQKKIDKNHNNKIDAQDFKILRGKKKVDEVLNPANKTIDTLAGRSKKVPKDVNMSNGHVSAKTELKVEGKGPEQDNVPFTPDKNVGDTADVTDKSGAKHTPMSRARHLAQMAM